MKLTKDILKDFDNLVVQHPNFMEAVNTTLTHLQLGSPGRLMLVVGPTGVGKTTLIRYCVKKLDEFVKENPNCGYAPPLVLQAPATEVGNFSWKDFYIGALHALREPAIDAKVDLDKTIAAFREGTRGYRLLAAHQLRRLFEQALRMRRPIAVFIDEIQHLAKCRAAIRKADHLDVLKAIADAANTSFVLAGTYETRAIMYHGGQLSRRINVNHFQRYGDADNGPDMILGVLRSISRKYELPLAKDVLSDPEYIYDHCLGCVGILVTWTRIAIEKAIRLNDRKLSMKHFEIARLTNLQLTAIAQEIAGFEAEHLSDERFDPRMFFLSGQPDNAEDVPERSPKHSKHRPGTRKPARDLVQR